MPKPPVRPKGWPTPIVTQEHVDLYFPNLYAKGWNIIYRTSKSKEGSPVSDETKATPSLEVRLMIQSQEMIADLENVVKDLERKEKVNDALHLF